MIKRVSLRRARRQRPLAVRGSTGVCETQQLHSWCHAKPNQQQAQSALLQLFIQLWALTPRCVRCVGPTVRLGPMRSSAITSKWTATLTLGRSCCVCNSNSRLIERGLAFECPRRLHDLWSVPRQGRGAVATFDFAARTTLAGLRNSRAAQRK